MTRSNLSDYSDAYIHFKETTTVPNTSEKGAASDDKNRKVICKSCAMCTICLSEINNTQVDDTHDIDIVIPTHNSIEYGDTCSKTLGHLQEYYRDEPALKDNGNIIDFPNDNNNNILFKFKQKIPGQKETIGQEIGH